MLNNQAYCIRYLFLRSIGQVLAWILYLPCQQQLGDMMVSMWWWIGLQNMHLSYLIKLLKVQFLNNVFKLHGIPKEIVSDKDSRCISTFREVIMSKLGIKLCSSTSFHPETDGQTERVNQWLECYLRHFVSNHQTKWVDWLYLAEFCYNSTPHVSIDMTPFFALYGHEPLQPLVQICQRL
ncbi:hypothetical protein O6H91_21G020200 [Diphasiastrum complanatum]|uniref:Uncharacterized protein n=1 Tax=Diphasiastrum complanatum TaxID=34168 RepID=A0ACC2AIE6_DIPCM|nr:hypothetical protein O6H91_21G020200 [Diphasiastrum complanatum]